MKQIARVSKVPFYKVFHKQLLKAGIGQSGYSDKLGWKTTILWLFGIHANTAV
jgi:hypothetical protein